jgi:hypothetical protein
MAEGEKFDIKKFFSSFFQLVPWLKNARMILGLIAVIFAASLIWRVFSGKPQSQSQRMIIYPFSFSTVTFSPQQSQKQEVKKRPWWLPILFVEGYGFTETSGLNSRTGIGGKAGGRLEW